jgi:ABC-type dipeptide/oligopeptide/nickel transport system permease subunit
VSDRAIAPPLTIADELLARPAPTFGNRLRKLGITARQNPLGTAGLIVILVFAILAVFAPTIAPYTAGELPGTKNEGPSSEFWFGTNRSGQDIFSRVVLGSRISLTVAFVSVIGGASLGIIIGIISGYTGGMVDSFIQRTVDTAIAFPALLLLLIITQSRAFARPAALLHINEDYGTIIFALMLAVIPGVTRVVRGAVLSEKNNQYVEAARAIGAFPPRVLFRHVLPNVVALGIIVMTSLLGGIILAEASLSFLGLGIPGAASWGQDVNTARQDFPYHIPSAFFPGAAITLTVLGFNLLGDSIRDIADPRLRGSR